VEAAGRRSFALDSGFELTISEAKPQVLRR
jgi:hypothetical protein